MPTPLPIAEQLAARDETIAELRAALSRARAATTVTKRHDCWNPACIEAQHNGQSCALCLGCQVIRDALNEVADAQKTGARK